MFFKSFDSIAGQISILLNNLVMLLQLASSCSQQLSLLDFVLSGNLVGLGFI